MGLWVASIDLNTAFSRIFSYYRKIPHIEDPASRGGRKVRMKCSEYKSELPPQILQIRNNIFLKPENHGIDPPLAAAEGPYGLPSVFRAQKGP